MDSLNLAVALQDETLAVAHEVSGGVADAADMERPAALLRGTSRGLEMHINARATVDAIVEALTRRLDEAPGFFRGSNASVMVDGGALPRGCLARLDELAAAFELTIVEIGAAKAKDPVPHPNLAAGSGPASASDGDVDEVPTRAIEPAPNEHVECLERVEREQIAEAPLALAPMPELPAPTSGTRLMNGPVRSGVILEHEGHLFIFGDVNPGAEVRATGNIVVLGRLRGTAHAAIGQEAGFILALHLEPQQLRIGRKVTRAGEDATPPIESEIAYIAGDAIVVEAYTGKLPRNLATSI
jgi:septum site-determining protein MinC